MVPGVGLTAERCGGDAFGDPETIEEALKIGPEEVTIRIRAEVREVLVDNGYDRQNTLREFKHPELGSYVLRAVSTPGAKVQVEPLLGIDPIRG